MINEIKGKCKTPEPFPGAQLVKRSVKENLVTDERKNREDLRWGVQ